VTIGSPSHLSPRLQTKTKNNTAKYRQRSQQQWREWETFSDAIASATPAQVSAWKSFEQYRLIINNHKTFNHMKVWESSLNTSLDSRYLWAIAGVDTLILSPRESAKSTYLAQWVSYQYGMHLSPWVRLALKVLGVSYNIDTAMPRSRQIQSILESTKYQEIFPWVRPSKRKWGEKEWMVDLGWAGLATTEEQYSYVCAGLTGAINSRRCVVGNTQVSIPDGKIPISQIKVGDRILSWNLQWMLNEWKTVEAIALHDAEIILQLTTKNNVTLQCTPDHKIFAFGQGYKEAQDLVRGDRLITEDGFDYFSHWDFAPPQKVYDIQVRGNHNFFGAGILLHNCHLVLLDDLIKSPEAIRARSVRDAMVSNWENVIQFTRYDGSRAVCLGTRMTADDIYCTTFTHEKGWNVIEQSALLEHPDGTEYSFWEPEHDKAPGMPLTRLQQERETTPIAFAFQRQNKIIRVKQQSIDPNLIQRGIIPARFDTLVLGVDLSAGLKDSNDYTAMVLGGVCQNADRPEYWIIDTWEDRVMGNTAKLDAMIEIWEMWKHLLPMTKLYNHTTGEWDDAPVRGLELWFDSSAYGLSLQGDYESHIIERHKITNWHVRPVPASGRGGKLERLRKHSGLFDNKLIHFNLYGRTMSDGRRPLGRLIQQITEFGSTSHDDLADAFELCMSGLRSHSPITKGNY
jgi:hypothetical protein